MSHLSPKHPLYQLEKQIQRSAAYKALKLMSKGMKPRSGPFIKQNYGGMNLNWVKYILSGKK